MSAEERYAPQHIFRRKNVDSIHFFAGNYVILASEREKGESYGTIDDGAAEEMERKQETKAADLMGIPAGGEDLAHERIWKGLLQECCLCFIL